MLHVSVSLLHVLYPIVFLIAVIIIILNCFVVQKPVRVPRQVEKNNQIIQKKYYKGICRNSTCSNPIGFVDSTYKKKYWCSDHRPPQQRRCSRMGRRESGRSSTTKKQQ